MDAGQRSGCKPGGFGKCQRGCPQQASRALTPRGGGAAAALREQWRCGAPAGGGWGGPAAVGSDCRHIHVSRWPPPGGRVSPQASH